MPNNKGFGTLLVGWILRLFEYFSQLNQKRDKLFVFVFRLLDNEM